MGSAPKEQTTVSGVARGEPWAVSADIDWVSANEDQYRKMLCPCVFTGFQSLKGLWKHLSHNLIIDYGQQKIISAVSFLKIVQLVAEPGLESRLPVL